MKTKEELYDGAMEFVEQARLSGYTAIVGFVKNDLNAPGVHVFCGYESLMLCIISKLKEEISKLGEK